MAPGTEIPLLTWDPRSRADVRSALERAPLHAGTLALDQSEQLAELLADSPCPVALVDIDSDAEGLLGVVERLSRQHPLTRFVLICRSLDTDLVLQAMQAGARHCVAKSTIESDLSRVVSRFLNEARPGPEARGALVTVLSASGGCGASSIAITCSSEASELAQQPCLIVDLDAAYGSIGSMLGVDPSYGIADVLSKIGSIDPELVRSTAVAHSDLLHVLASPASVNFSNPPPLSFDNLESALVGIKQAYPLAVVDAPRVPMSVAARLAEQSHATLIVFQIDVVGVRMVRSIFSALSERRVPHERIVAVANRYNKRGGTLGLSDVQAALGDVTLVTVRNDYESVLRAINRGQVLSKAAPRTAVRKDVGELLRHIQLPARVATR